MSESSAKRPPHPPAAEAPRPEPRSAVPAIEASPEAPALPQPRPAAARTGNPGAAPSALALFDALAHGAEAFADEMAGLAQTGFADATDTAKAMLSARTLSEALEINAGYVRKSLDTMLAGSVRLTDITARLAEASLRPLMP